MILDLRPARGEPEFGVPALTGDWAVGLPEMLAGEQVAPWCSYAVRRDGVLVGLGGFKGPPDGQGQVEISYLTFKPVEGQGIATAVAGALVRVAMGQGARRVVAHTLPEGNASTRALVRNGFAFDGAIEDPEDGLIWRWTLTQEPSPRA